MTDVLQLIHKHLGNGLLVDTNLLLLHLIGRTNKNRILKFKRTQAYTIEDFELLERFIAEFKILITTPHVLTEVSNLGDLSRPGTGGTSLLVCPHGRRVPRALR